MSCVHWLKKMAPSTHRSCRYCPHSSKETQGVVDEQVRVLEEKPVTGVGIDDQLGVREKLRHRKRVNRRHHHVVAAVRNQHWLLDFRQMVVSRIALAPCYERLELSLDPFLRNRRLN